LPPATARVASKGAWRWYYSCLCDAAVAPSAHQLFLKTPGALPGVGIEQRIAVALEFGESELREPSACSNPLPGARNESPVFAASMPSRVGGQFVPQAAARAVAGVGHQR